MKQYPMESRPSSETCSEPRSKRSCLLSALSVLCLGWFSLVGLSCSGGGLGDFDATPDLPEFNSRGEYDPYYSSGEMNLPRYIHEAILMETGLILVAGGSDENGFSSLDLVEMFDQSTIKQNELRPETGLGTWFDTDFEGEQMVMENARVQFTMSELFNDTIIMIGGTGNLDQAREIENVEVFDPLTRTLEVLEEGMFLPRFRHAASVLPNGGIMITGGQVFNQFTDQDTVNVQGGGNFGSGQVNVQMQIDTFPSIKKNELFNLAESKFEPLQILDTRQDADLTTRRGRAGHTVARFAGPDNRNNTGDDLYLLVGGFQTLSGGNAPQFKAPGAGGTSLVALEFYDPLIEIFTRVPALSLLGSRINWPQATNLGLFSEFTPDRVLGLGNVILIANGDNNAQQGQRVTTGEGEVLVATYTGFGPAQGLSLVRQPSQNGGHIQGIEASVSLGVFELAGCNPFAPGRSTTNFVPMPRRIENDFLETAIFNVAGCCFAICPPGVQVVLLGGTIDAGVLFDPFFSLEAALDFELSPRDLTSGRLDARNPTGVVGCWLLLDGEIPTTDPGLDVFGTTPPFNWASMADIHCWAKVLQVAGPDGVVGTPKDRLVIIGGGQPFGPGQDPISPSTEILILPGQGSDFQ